MLLARCLLVLASVCAALVVGEVVLRVRPDLAGSRMALAYDAETLDAIAIGDRQVSFDVDLGWLLTPYLERKAQGAVYRHNRASLRVSDLDRDYSPSPGAGVQRLAAYGDSFTYCATVSMSQCWTKRLEDALPSAEVLNFGVPGYGPDQAWLRYQRERTAWQPCGVLIGVMLENIGRVVNRFRPFYQGETSLPLGKPRFLVEDGRPVLLPNPARSLDDLKDPAWVEANLGPRDYWYARDGGSSPARLLRLVRTVSVNHGWNLRQAQDTYQPGTEPFEVLTAVVTGFANQVRADGASPVVLLFPTDVEITEQRDQRTNPHQALLDDLQARGIPYVDLTETLGRAARTRKLGALIEGHYRPAGNDLIAETLEQRLPELVAPTCGASNHRG